MQKKYLEIKDYLMERIRSRGIQAGTRRSRRNGNWLPSWV